MTVARTITDVLDKLDAIDLDVLAEALQRGGLTVRLARASWYDRRDEAIRQAAELVAPGAGRKPAARALAVALARYAAAGWLRERHLQSLDGDDPVRSALHRVLQLNRGEPLGFEQLRNILGGVRH